ncbi:hypothetical protein [Dyadobacter sp.]|uniref:hypothetical protein n=1 Tax=Dyadobacter sp. TaxID=1914288 RepID=UPI003F6E5625
MSLVQKLPIGLGLACMMMLSSCLKEDVQTPEPQVGGVNESSGLRGDVSADPNVPPGGWQVLPQIPATSGLLGLGVYAPGWRKIHKELPASPQVLPSGTSNFKYLWGSLNSPWTKKLPLIPEIPSTASFITLAAVPDNEHWADAAVAEARLRYLKPGKKYVINVFVASSITSESEAYPRYLWMKVSKCISNTLAQGTCAVAGAAVLIKEQGTWVKEEIYFDATDTEMALDLLAYAGNAQGKTGYFNIYIDKSSIKQLN